MQKMKKPMSILLSFIMVFSLFTVIPVTANAAQGVEYIYRDWDYNNNRLIEETRTCTDYTNLSDYEAGKDYTLAQGWYVAANKTFGQLTTNGEVHIIVPNGVTMKCTKGILVVHKLYIYGQQNDEGTLDVYNSTHDCAAIGGSDRADTNEINIVGGTVKAESSDDAAGIGSGEDHGYSSINIYGGKVTAKGSSYGAGIGSGASGKFGTVRIYSGEVTAIGGNRGAGIGGGNHCDGSHVVIHGGTVNATGGDWGAGIGGGNTGLGGSLSISGGKVTAKGGFGGAGVGGGDGAYRRDITNIWSTALTFVATGGELTAIGGDEAAGIGGGNQEEERNDGRIEISGGTIIATGGANYGAGIGGGDQQKNSPPVTITGGKVTATGGVNAAGIGGGDKGSSSGITINGGEVIANGGINGAGIGNGNGATGGIVEIKNGNVTAKGGNYAAGIGGGNNYSEFCTVKIQGGTVDATGGIRGAGIGGGEKCTGGTVIIDGGQNVVATGGIGGAGIGKGSNTDADSIQLTFNSGSVNAYGGKGLYDQSDQTGIPCAPAIGGTSFNGKIVFNGGNIKATGSYDDHYDSDHALSYAYGHGTAIGTNSEFPRVGEIHINPGVVINTYIQGFDAAPSYHYYADKLFIFDTENNTSSVQYDSAYAATADRVKACGWKAVNIEIKPCDHAEYSYEQKDGDHHSKNCCYCTYTEELPHNEELTSWTWSEGNSVATANFRCRDCGYTASVNAVVTSTDIGSAYRYEASATYKDKGYSTIRKVYFDGRVDEGVYVTWLNTDGTVLDYTFSQLGAQPPYAGDTPEKPGTDSSEYTFVGWTDGAANYILPDTPPGVTTHTEYTPIYKYKNQTEPHIDAAGAYIPGKKAHYFINNEYYAINEDSTVGSILNPEDVEISHFTFELLDDYTYRINKYTGSSRNLTELVIPKTYRDKKVTVVGDDTLNSGLFDHTQNPNLPFTVVLNENITKIGTSAFDALNVKEVKGDTSNLKQIDKRAFAIPSFSTGYILDIKLDYPGVINLGEDVFYNQDLTLRIKHATTFSTNQFSSFRLRYEFTDAHTLTPSWHWEEDNSSATLTLACSDSRCQYQKTFNATVTSKKNPGKLTYTATVEALGEIYTNTKEIDAYSVRWLNDDGTELYKDECLLPGTVPAYTDPTPEKENCTFIGWSDGDRTYSPEQELPPITTQDVTYKAVYSYKDGIGARLFGYTISLQGDIAVNFYMELSDNVIYSENNPYMQFKVSDTEAENKEQKVYLSGLQPVRLNDKNYYVFKCHVAAKNINSPVEAQLIDGDDKSAIYTYSVREYANYLLEHTSNPEYADAAPLVKAMLHYGAAAQVQFGSTNAPANNGIESNGWEDVTAADINKPYDETKTTLPDGVSFTKVTLSLKSETSLSLYFTSEKDLVFSCGDKTVEVDNVGSAWVARIRGIKASELGEDFVLSVSDGTTNGSVTYSPMTYCYNVLDRGTDDANLTNVVKTLYLYWQAAKDYRN